MDVEKADIKIHPTEESHMGLPEATASCPGSPISDNCKDSLEYLEVKPEIKEQLVNMETLSEPENQDDDSNFDIKNKLNAKESSASEKSNWEDSEEDKVLGEFLYESVFSKNYKQISVKEEPIDNFKSIFKESSLNFEKREYHQQIFEDIISNSTKISVKDLQEEYMAQLHKAANIDIFICSVCEYQTMKLTNLQCHLLSIHNIKLEQETFKCNKCDYKCNFKSYMTRHLEGHRDKVRKKFKSVQKYKTASREFKEAVLSSSVKKQRTNKEKFPCTECSYKGRTEDGLRRHMAAHKDRTKCDLCEFACQDRNEMKKHKETHIVNKYYQCYKCSYKNGNKTTLGRHLFNEHKISNEASKRSKICEICSFACSNFNALKIHYTSHKSVNELKDEEIFKCPEPGCNHQTKLKNHLKIHMKIHEPPKFVCETCGLASRRKQTYEDHISTHKKASEIQWLQCPTCPYRARIKAHLRAHIRKGVHGEPMKRHIRLKYREGDQPVKKPAVKRIKITPNEDGSDKHQKPKRKRKPKPKSNVVLDEAIVNTLFNKYLFTNSLDAME